MARPRLSMRKFNEVLRLKHHCGLSKRQIAQSCQISRSTVADYLWRAEQAGVSWPLPQDLTDQELEQKLFPPQTALPLQTKPLPDFEDSRVRSLLLLVRKRKKGRCSGGQAF